MTDNIWTHTFITCTYSLPAMNYVLSLIRVIDPDITATDALRLQFNTTNETDLLVCVTIVAEVLLFVFENRKSHAVYTTEGIKAELKLRSDNLLRSYKHKTAGAKLLSLLF